MIQFLSLDRCLSVSSKICKVQVKDNLTKRVSHFSHHNGTTCSSTHALISSQPLSPSLDSIQGSKWGGLTRAFRLLSPEKNILSFDVNAPSKGNKESNNDHNHGLVIKR